MRKQTKFGLLELAAVLTLGVQVVSPASAQTPALTADACTAFKWPVTEARQAMAGAIPKVASGEKAPGDFELALTPFDNVHFPMKPERTPKRAGTFGGFVTADAAKGKNLQVTLSDEAWVDVIQDGKAIKSAGFSGKEGCEGVRKSVRFPLTSAQPVTIQISGADGQTIRVDLRGVE